MPTITVKNTAIVTVTIAPTLRRVLNLPDAVRKAGRNSRVWI